MSVNSVRQHGQIPWKIHLPKADLRRKRKILSAFIPIAEIEFIVKYLPARKAPNPCSFTGEFYPAFKDEIIPFFHAGGRNSFQLTVWNRHNPNVETWEGHYKKGKYQNTMNMDAKFLIRILANQVQQCIKRIRYHNQVGLIFQKCNLVQHSKTNQCSSLH